MTGEITLRGRVLPVGGLREKVMAAHRAGIKTVIVPKRNDVDMDKVPAKVLRDLNVVYVSRLDEVFPISLAPITELPTQPASAQQKEENDEAD